MVLADFRLGLGVRLGSYQRLETPLMTDSSMRKMFVLLICFLVLVPRVFAQALPVSPMQNAVSGVMQQKMLSRGFAANDPRFGATLSRSSNAIAGVAGTAAAVTVGAVTAPGWVSVAIAAGIGAVVTYAVTLGIDALVNWLFRTDGKIDQSSSANLSYDASGFNAGDTVWVYTDFGGVKHYGGSPEPLARQFRYDDLVRQGVANPSEPTCFANGTVGYFCGNYQVTLTGSAPVTCGRGMQAVGTSCTAYSYPLPTSVPTTTGLTLQQAINNIPAADRDKQLNPALLAAVADQAWRSAAAQPGYDGLPYQASDPITQTDASRWQTANPNSWPKVSDFVNPQATPSGGTAASPWVLPNTASPVSNYSPSTSPQQTTSTNPSTQPVSNLGPDPGIGQPTLEATPTAQQILQPILSLFPDLRSYVVPSHSGVCPKPSMDLWGKHLVLDGHCNLLEDNRAAIQAVMAMVWVMVALFIILAA